MQSLGRYYVRYVNAAHGRSGTLWEGRYKSSLVDSEHYFLLVSRYIELNPVRAGMTEYPAAYPWSSDQHNALNRDSVHFRLVHGQLDESPPFSQALMKV